MGLLDSFKKEVLDDVFGIESPKQLVEAASFAGLPAPPPLAEKIEKEFGTSWESGGEMFGPAPEVAWGTSVTPVTVTEPDNGLDTWAWTQNYLAGQRAVAEQAQIQSQKEAEAMAKQTSSARAAPNGAILQGIVPVIILLYMVWTK